VIAGGRIAIDDPRDHDVRALLERHLEFALAQTPPKHSFALDADGLLDPAITLFSIRVHGSLLGIGAIKRLGPGHAEIKSMHTAETARGHGIGRAILTHLLEVARAQGFRRVSLETGTTRPSPRPGHCTRAQASFRVARSAATSPARTTSS
jgi:putative acetyltransferase